MAAAPGCCQPQAAFFLSNGQNVEAWEAATGKALWYSQIGGLGAPPETFMLDGKQHMLFSAGNGPRMYGRTGAEQDALDRQAGAGMGGRTNNLVRFRRGGLHDRPNIR